MKETVDLGLSGESALGPLENFPVVIVLMEGGVELNQRFRNRPRSFYDKFWQRASGGGHNWGSLRHCLDHNTAEGLQTETSVEVVSLLGSV